MKLKDTNYLTIQAFMVNDLQLKGNELLIYAILYGFSQNDEDRYTGGLQYLCNWTNSTKQGVIKNLKSLLDKGYIGKIESVKNNVKFAEYYVVEFTTGKQSLMGGGKQSLMGGGKQSLPNNIYIDNKNIDNINIIKEKSKKESEENSLINNYTENEELRTTLIEFVKMRKLIKKPLTDRALKIIFGKLNKLSDNDNGKIEILNQSIVNNWQDVYMVKDNNNNYNTYKSTTKIGAYTISKEADDAF